MSTELTGKSAIVTGAGAGLGKAAALLLARRGARVLAADVNRAAADHTAGMIGAAGGDASAVTVDVADPAAVQAMVDTCVERFGRLDVAVNNAGIPESWRQLPTIRLKRGTKSSRSI